ncbi:MAG: septum site-determining protein MinD [Clostridia bacterium]|nr:septum site-determining protein MinD [Clostridia bacterium]
MARIIVVTGGKGGVGKTTVAAALAACLAKKGERTIVCDADFGLNNIDVTLGVEKQVAYEIADIVEGKCRAKQALVPHPKIPNLFVLCSKRSDLQRYVSAQQIKAVLESLSQEFDYIFIDSPAGIDEGFHRAVAPASEAIVVTAPHISAVRDADKAVTILKSYELSKVSLVVNGCRGELILSGEELSPDQIASVLKLPLLGIVPYEYSLSVSDFSVPHKSIRLLAESLKTGKEKLYDPTRQYSGFFGSIKRALKRSL